MKEYYIYAHKSKITSKILYVGTGSDYTNSNVTRAYDFRKRKYKLEEVEVIILPNRYIDKKEAFRIEEIITHYYHSIGECQYNIYEGSKVDGSLFVGEKNGAYGRKHTKEEKEKMSQNHYDCNGENNGMYGRNHSKETKEKMRANKKTHIVYCYETNKYYKGTGEAQEDLDMNRGAISNCCRRHKKGYSKKYKMYVTLEYRD